MNNTDEMERDPDIVRGLFLASMADEPPPPPAAEQIRASKRGLKRRRIRITAVAAATVGAALLVPPLLNPSAQSDQSPTNGVTSLTPDAMIEQCRKGNQSSRATNTLFESGTPEVRLSGTVAQTMSVVLVSADGRYWADCFITLYKGAEFKSGMTVYPPAGDKPANGFGFSTGFTCKDLDGPPAPPCTTFMVDYVDRVANEVAAVSFDTADGKTTTVQAEDGFILFAYSGEIPDGYPTTDTITRPETPPWLTRVTYLDINGDPIAAENFGRARAEGKKVGDLPTLQAFPSRRGEPIW